MMDNKKEMFKVEANQGHLLAMAGGNYRIIISGDETDGSFALIEMNVNPGSCPVPHAHELIEETFYVIEGEAIFTSEKGVIIAKQGDCVAIPKGGLIHQFGNLGEKPVKLLCTVIPAGLEEYYIEVSDLFESKENKPDSPVLKETLSRLAEKYGLKLFPPNYFKNQVKSA